jgi:hypothetical protein
VFYQIEQGVIQRQPDGTVSTEQADAAWQPSRGPTSPPEDRRRRQAQVTTQMVKINLAKVQLDRVQARYVERSMASEIILNDLDDALRTLATAHVDYAPMLATELAIDQALAQTILQRVVSKALDELGDIRAEVQRAVDRL